MGISMRQFRWQGRDMRTRDSSSTATPATTAPPNVVRRLKRML